MTQYRVLLEYWTPNENDKLFEEKIIHSLASGGTLADRFLSADRKNLLRSIEVTPIS